MSATSQPADWDRLWIEKPNTELMLREQATPRWQAIEGHILRKYGSFEGLDVVEVGSGHGTNGLLFGLRGAKVTLIDQSDRALDGAKEAANKLGTSVRCVKANLFDLPPELVGVFDVSCSFGLCEHFLGTERRAVFQIHTDLLKTGGSCMNGIPNAASWPYRAWMGTLKRRGTWPLGTEEPFSEDEAVELTKATGATVDEIAYGSFAHALVNFLMNPVLHKVGFSGVKTPQFKTPLDRMAYELLVISTKR